MSFFSNLLINQKDLINFIDINLDSMEYSSIQLTGREGLSNVFTNQQADIVIIQDKIEKQKKECKSNLPHTSLGQYRSDIDGLRTIAVIGVVFSHTWPQIYCGGGMGVDVFFVVSGYLISKIIFKELRTSQSLSFSKFYSRRIRRIFPALITMLIFAFVLQCKCFNPFQLKEASKTLIAGTLMGTNFQFLHKIRNNLSTLNPALVLWTLGVEQQFYLFWPLISLILWRLPMLIGLTIIGIAAFLLLYMYVGFTFDVFSQWDVSLTLMAYWQILVGCSVAYYQQKKIQKKQQQQKQILPENVNQKIQSEEPPRQLTLWQKTKSINGIITSIAALLIFYSLKKQGNTTQTMFACWRILIVFSTATFLHFKIGIFNNFLLGNRITRFFGKISYSWYLLHMSTLIMCNFFSGNKYYKTLAGFTLAVIVTFDIQNNIRWRKSKLVVPCLLVTMVLLLILFTRAYYYPEYFCNIF